VSILENLEVEGRFFGKYRSRVTDNVDPLGIARLKLDVPAVPGTTELWALPCVPYAGNTDSPVGMHIIPPLGAHVWVEFEGGDPSHPIWTGCYWDEKTEFPNPGDLEADDPPLVKILKTDCSVFTIDDAEENKGSITLEIDAPAVEEKVTLVFDNDGALLTTGISSIAVHPTDGITLKVEETTITLTKDDIQLKSKAIGTTSDNDTTVTATGGLTLKASKAAALQSGTTLGLKAGSSGTLESSAAMTVKGGSGCTVQAGATLDLKGGATVNVKGPMVNLN
jgi:uncharacterized protein involved in type VI secretion and phage assembly